MKEDDIYSSGKGNPDLEMEFVYLKISPEFKEGEFSIPSSCSEPSTTKTIESINERLKELTEKKFGKGKLGGIDSGNTEKKVENGPEPTEKKKKYERY